MGLTDPNGDRVAAGHDGLGQLERTSCSGKLGDTAMDSLAERTTLVEYDRWAWHDGGKPVWMRTQVRELHGVDRGGWLETHAYADGLDAPLVRVAGSNRPTPEDGPSRRRLVAPDVEGTFADRGHERRPARRLLGDRDRCDAAPELPSGTRVAGRCEETEAR